MALKELAKKWFDKWEEGYFLHLPISENCQTYQPLWNNKWEKAVHPFGGSQQRQIFRPSFRNTRCYLWRGQGLCSV